MLHYLIKVTDNCLVTVIVLGFLLFLCRNAGAKRWGPGLAGLAMGGFAALVYAILKRNTGFAVREYYDLGVLVPSVLLTLILIPALWTIGREGRQAGPAGKALLVFLLGCCTASILPNLLLYPFEFAVGMETVFNTDFFLRVSGFALGALIAFLLGLAVYQTAGHMPRRFLLAGLTALLLVLAAKQGLEIAQILVARNMIPRSPWLMSALIFILTQVNWFAFLFMGILALMTVAHLVRMRMAPLTGPNPAAIRKRKALASSQTRYAVLVLLCLLLSTLTITAIREYDSRGVVLSEPEIIPVTDGTIVIPLERINDGNLHRFMHRTPDGVAIRYIIIRKTESAYGVGLDACDICGPSGYYQRKDEVICILCDVVMNKLTIGFPGGCNPVPLNFTISRGNMLIRAADLDGEKQRFR